MAAIKPNHSAKKFDNSDAMTSMGEMWKASSVDLPLVLYGETLRFMAHRLQAQADHLASLTRCKSVSEALESQATFTQKTVSDYVAETSTIMQEASSVVKLPDPSHMSVAA